MAQEEREERAAEKERRHHLRRSTKDQIINNLAEIRRQMLEALRTDHIFRLDQDILTHDKTA